MNGVLKIAGLIALVALLPTGLSAQSKKPQPKAKADPWQVESAPPRRQPAANSCMQYGAGFVRLPGSDTCIRMGGGLDVSVGARSGANR
jgi:hypothetical protein